MNLVKVLGALVLGVGLGFLVIGRIDDPGCKIMVSSTPDQGKVEWKCGNRIVNSPRVTDKFYTGRFLGAYQNGDYVYGRFDLGGIERVMRIGFMNRTMGSISAKDSSNFSELLSEINYVDQMFTGETIAELNKNYLNKYVDLSLRMAVDQSAALVNYREALATTQDEQRKKMIQVWIDYLTNCPKYLKSYYGYLDNKSKIGELYSFINSKLDSNYTKCMPFVESLEIFYK